MSTTRSMVRSLRLIILVLIPSIRCHLRNGSKVNSLRIYKGYEVDIDQYPHAAFLFFETTSPSSCGGSLIMVQAVLTAAHCVDELRYKRGKMHAYFGSTVPIKSKVVRKVIDFRIHPRYSEKEGKNNLAVAWLVDRVPLHNQIKKILLSNIEVKPKTVVYGAGWGKQKVTNGIPKLPDFSTHRSLRATQQVILSYRECSQALEVKRSYGLLCSMPRNGHFYKDDSGDGLVTKTPMLLLVGVLSFVAEGISIHTEVHGHRKWIIESSFRLYEKNCIKKGR